jgi:hypothetical protein
MWDIKLRGCIAAISVVQNWEGEKPRAHAGAFGCQSAHITECTFGTQGTSRHMNRGPSAASGKLTRSHHFVACTNIFAPVAEQPGHADESEGCGLGPNSCVQGAAAVGGTRPGPAIVATTAVP